MLAIRDCLGALGVDNFDYLASIIHYYFCYFDASVAHKSGAAHFIGVKRAILLMLMLLLMLMMLFMLMLMYINLAQCTLLV